MTVEAHQVPSIYVPATMASPTGRSAFEELRRMATAPGGGAGGVDMEHEAVLPLSIDLRDRLAAGRPTLLAGADVARRATAVDRVLQALVSPDAESWRRTHSDEAIMGALQATDTSVPAILAETGLPASDPLGGLLTSLLDGATAAQLVHVAAFLFPLAGELATAPTGAPPAPAAAAAAAAAEVPPFVICDAVCSPDLVAPPIGSGWVSAQVYARNNCLTVDNVRDLVRAGIVPSARGRTAGMVIINPEAVWHTNFVLLPALLAEQHLDVDAVTDLAGPDGWFIDIKDLVDGTPHPSCLPRGRYVHRPHWTTLLEGVQRGRTLRMPDAAMEIGTAVEEVPRLWAAAAAAGALPTFADATVMVDGQPCLQRGHVRALHAWVAANCTPVARLLSEDMEDGGGGGGRGVDDALDKVDDALVAALRAKGVPLFTIRDRLHVVAANRDAAAAVCNDYLTDLVSGI